MGFLSRFFHGRNGRDQLNIALLVLGIFFSLLSRFLFDTFFSILSYAFLLLCVFRILSRNLPRRQAENALFLEATKGIRARFSPGAVQSGGSTKGKRTRVKKDRANFRYFKCPDCKQAMRVPRGRGKVKVTCPNCGLVLVKEV